MKMFKNLLSWSQQEFSHLPWRKKRTLYRTLVSEIMLQQTTVGTVLNHFEKFILEYPDFAAVASASEERLTISWKGLGYYRRARNLKKACSFFVEKYGGTLPLDFEALKKAPGIGDYTANALLAIGADEKALALDANLERVLARLYGLRVSKGTKLQKELQRLFEAGEICSELERLGPRSYHESLMDLGRNYCKANKAACSLCPLSPGCAAFNSGDPLALPVNPTAPKKKSFEITLLRLLQIKDNKIMLAQRKEQQWLAGQYELPTFILESDDPNLDQYPRLKYKEHHLLPEYKTLITKYKIKNKVMVVNDEDLKKLKVDEKAFTWRIFDKEELNLSTASLKALRLIG